MTVNISQDFTALLEAHGFEPWQCGKLQGWHRRTDFVKDCLAGEIARYSAEDYILSVHEGKLTEQWLKKNWPSKEDVIKQRFLLLDSDFSELYVKSYWLGIKGWLEVLHYRKGDQEKRFADLIYFAEFFRSSKF